MSVTKESDEISPEDVEALIAAEQLPENRIFVSETLTKLHPLVRHTYDHLKAISKPKEKFRWADDDNCLAVVVTPAQLSRAMRILDALLKAIAGRGYRIEPQGPQRDGARIFVLGVEHQIRLEEMVDRSDRKLTEMEDREKKQAKREGQVYVVQNRYVYTPNGALHLIRKGPSGGRENWKDSQGKKRPRPDWILEHRLNDVMSEILRASGEELRRIRERQEDKLRWMRIEMLRFEESQRVKAFNALSDAWHDCADHRRIAAAVRAETLRRGEAVDDSTPVGRWLAWAEKRADELDPLAPGKALPGM